MDLVEALHTLARQRGRGDSPLVALRAVAARPGARISHLAVSQRLAEAWVTVTGEPFHQHQSLALAALRRGEPLALVGGVPARRTMHLLALELLRAEAPATALLLAPDEPAAAAHRASLGRIAAALGEQLRVGLALGDEARAAMAAHVVVATPAALHERLLRHHDRAWAPFWSRLRLIIAAEAHAYDGLAAGHLAALLRRALRLAPAGDAGAQRPRPPQLAATIGPLAAADEALTQIAGVTWRIIPADDTPAPEAAVALWRAAGERAHEVAAVVTALARAGAAVHVTCPAFEAPLLRALIGADEGAPITLGPSPLPAPAQVFVGLAGAAAHLRQALDGAALAVVILGDDPAERTMARLAAADPGQIPLLDGPPPTWVAAPGNAYVLAQHLVCAASERPVSAEEVGLWQAASLIPRLEERGLLIALPGPEAAWQPLPSGDDPYHALDLRGAGSAPARLRDERGRVLGTLDQAAFDRWGFAGAALPPLRGGYRVLARDEDALELTLRPAPEWRRALPLRRATVRVRDRRERRTLRGREAAWGRVVVEEEVIGYREATHGATPAERTLPAPITISWSAPALWVDLPAPLGTGGQLVGWSLAAALQLRATAAPGDLAPIYDEEARRLYFVDAQPGGSGLAAWLYGALEELLPLAYDVALDCRADPLLEPIARADMDWLLALLGGTTEERRPAVRAPREEALGRRASAQPIAPAPAHGRRPASDEPAPAAAEDPGPLLGSAPPPRGHPTPDRADVEPRVRHEQHGTEGRHADRETWGHEDDEAWEHTDDEAHERERQARIAHEAQEREAWEREAEEAWEREKQARAAREAQEREERQARERERQTRAAREKQEREAREAQERAEQARLTRERQERETREAQERAEQARLTRERQERAEQARLTREKQERAEQARLTRERQERETREAQERAEQARLTRERQERETREAQEREEQARLAREKQEREEQARLAREKQEREEQARLAREKQEREEQARLAREKQEREEQARLAREVKAREEREAQERAEQARRAREAQERAEQARRAREKQEREEREAQERAEQARRAREKQEREEREAQERAEQARLVREVQAHAEQEARRREERERTARAEQERLAREAQERAEQEARQRAEQREWEAQERTARKVWEEEQRRAREERERLEREAQEREAREREARERAEREAQEARERAERLAQEAQERAEREAQERAEREAQERALREARARAEKAERERLARERKAQEARERAEQAERERLAREQAAAEARAHAEQAEREARARERKAQEARERAERSGRTPPEARPERGGDRPRPGQPPRQPPPPPEARPRPGQPPRQPPPPPEARPRPGQPPRQPPPPPEARPRPGQPPRQPPPAPLAGAQRSLPPEPPARRATPPPEPEAIPDAAAMVERLRRMREQREGQGGRGTPPPPPRAPRASHNEPAEARFHPGDEIVCTPYGRGKVIASHIEDDREIMLVSFPNLGQLTIDAAVSAARLADPERPTWDEDLI